MAAAAQSDIEVFFKAYGSDAVVRQMQSIARAGVSIGSSAASAGLSVAKNLGSGLVSALSLTGKAIDTVALGGPRLALGLAGGIESAIAKFAVLRVAAQGFGGAIENVGKQVLGFVNSSSELTSVVLGLRAVNSEVAKSGNLPSFTSDAKGNLQDPANGKKTARDLLFLNNTAANTGVTLQSLTRDYLSLKASTEEAGISTKETESVFQGVARAGVVLGRTPEQLHNAFYALQEIGDRGQVYAQQLRRQLAIALPGVLQLAAKSFGVSVKEFNQMVESGVVDAGSFFKNLGRELNQEYGKAISSATETTRVALVRLGNAFFNAKVIIGNGALDKTVREIVVSATTILKTLTADGALKQFGANLATAIQPISNYLKATQKNVTPFVAALKFASDVVAALVRGIFVMKDVFVDVLASIRNITAAFRNLGITLPSVGGVIVGFFDTIRKITEVIRSREFSDSPFANFIASLYVLAEQVTGALLKAFGAPVRGVLSNFGGVLQLLADNISQAASAVKSLSSGTIDPTLNSQGLQYLLLFVEIRDAVYKVIDVLKLMFAFSVAAFKGVGVFFGFLYDAVGGDLSGKAQTTGQKILAAFDITDVAAAWQDFLALISGADASVAVDGQLDKLFAYRKALGALITGQDQPKFFDNEGNETEDKFLNTLFRIRDTLKNVFALAVTAFSFVQGYFDGAYRAATLIVGAFNLVVDSLNRIGQFTGLGDLGKDMLYVFGYAVALTAGLGILRTALFALGAPGIIAGIGAIGTAFVGMFSSTAFASLALSYSVNGLTGVFSTLALVLKSSLTSFAGFEAAMKAIFAIPLVQGLVVIGIFASLAFIIYKVYTNWTLLTDSFRSGANAITGFFLRLGASINKTLAGLVEHIPLIGKDLAKALNIQADVNLAQADINDRENNAHQFRQSAVDELSQKSGKSRDEAGRIIDAQIRKTGTDTPDEQNATAKAVDEIIKAAQKKGKGAVSDKDDQRDLIRGISDQIREAQKAAGLQVDKGSDLNQRVRDGLSGADLNDTKDVSARIQKILSGQDENSDALGENTGAIKGLSQYLEAYRNGTTQDQQAFAITQATRDAIASQRAQPEVDDSPVVMTPYERLRARGLGGFTSGDASDVSAAYPKAPDITLPDHFTVDIPKLPDQITVDIPKFPDQISVDAPDSIDANFTSQPDRTQPQLVQPDVRDRNIVYTPDVPNPMDVIAQAGRINDAGLEAANQNVATLRDQVQQLQAGASRGSDTVYRKPVVIPLGGGRNLTLMGDVADEATIEQLAANANTSRAQGAAAYMG
jgi:tape measure domain-containing protein